MFEINAILTDVGASRLQSVKAGPCARALYHFPVVGEVTDPFVGHVAARIVNWRQMQAS